MTGFEWMLKWKTQIETAIVTVTRPLPTCHVWHDPWQVFLTIIKQTEVFKNLKGNKGGATNKEVSPNQTICVLYNFLSCLVAHFNWISVCYTLVFHAFHFDHSMNAKGSYNYIAILCNAYFLDMPFNLLPSLAKILSRSCHDLGKNTMAMQDRVKAKHE